jgi:hypothetical protein
VMSCCRGGFAVAGDGGASAWCCGFSGFSAFWVVRVSRSRVDTRA